MTEQLTSKHRRQLRAMAHDLDPVARLGKDGLTEPVIEAVKKALDDHELIKVKFVEHKDERQSITDELTSATDSQQAGMIGNIAILYRQNPDPEKRKVKI